MGDQPWIHRVVITFLFPCFPSFSKAILKTTELPSLCNVVSSSYQLFVAHFAMGIFMSIYLHYRINKHRDTQFEFSSNSLDCWFNHGLNHSEIHSARQFIVFFRLYKFFEVDKQDTFSSKLTKLAWVLLSFRSLSSKQMLISLSYLTPGRVKCSWNWAFKLAIVLSRTFEVNSSI